MRVYRVRLGGKTRLAGSQDEARKLKLTLLHNANLGPRSAEATVDEIELPTKKADLLEYVNAAVAHAEGSA